jgi:hypothetical protein
VEVVVEDWRRDAAGGREGHAMLLEEIFAAILEGDGEREAGR